MVWTHLFGRAPHAPVEPVDRLIAIDCAIRLTGPSTIASGVAEAGRITFKAQRLEEWLLEAHGDERDAQIRRLVLLLVCQHASPSMPLDRIRGLAKELHRFATRR